MICVAGVRLVVWLGQGDVVLAVVTGEVSLVKSLALGPVDSGVVVVARCHTYQVTVVVEERSQRVERSLSWKLR